MHKALQRIRERKTAPFIEWGPASIQVGCRSDNSVIKWEKGCGCARGGDEGGRARQHRCLSGGPQAYRYCRGGLCVVGGGAIEKGVCVGVWVVCEGGGC